MATLYDGIKTETLHSRITTLKAAYADYQAAISGTTGSSKLDGAITVSESNITSDLSSVSAFVSGFPSTGTVATYITNLDDLLGGMCEHGLTTLIATSARTAEFNTKLVNGLFMRELAMTHFAITAVDDPTDDAAIDAAFTDNAARDAYLDYVISYADQRIKTVQLMKSFRLQMND